MTNNILIVDDLERNLDLLEAIIENTIDNCNIIKAYDGIEALDHIYNNDIDLIVLDLALPEKDGIEVLKEIKSNNNYSDIPIIVHSGISNMDVIKKTLEIGARDYFTKPLSSEDIDIYIPIKIKNALKYYSHRKYLIRRNKQSKEEIRLARMLQNSLMFNNREGNIADSYASYLPSTGLGGDCYDFVETQNSLWFMIADVTGHGLTSSMVSFMVKALFNQAISQYSTPKRILSSMNKTFCSMMSDNSIIFTAFVGLVRNDRLIYSNAGHPYPIYYDSQQNKLSFLKQNSMIMGIDREFKFRNNSIHINKKDKIFLFTDGLYEKSKTDNNLNNVLDFTRTYKKLLIKDSKEFLNKIVRNVVTNRTLNDDIATLIINIK